MYININKAFSYSISTFAQKVLPRQPRVGVVVLLLLRAQHLLQEPLLLLAPYLRQDNVSTQRLAVPIGMAPELERVFVKGLLVLSECIPHTMNLSAL